MAVFVKVFEAKLGVRLELLVWVMKSRKTSAASQEAVRHSSWSE